MTNLQIASKRLSDYKSNDKSGLFYKLQHVNHTKYFYSYIESFTRKEVLALLIAEISTSQGWDKFVQLEPFKNLKDTNKLNYAKLMEHNPTIYDTMVNSLGQTIELVEHPLKGDSTFVLAICHELKLASYTDFFETDDMLEDHREYEPLFIDNQLQHGK